MSPANRDSFNFFLSNFYAYDFFVLSDGSARTSSTVLNRSVESGHPCLVPHLTWQIFNLSPMSMMLAVGLPYMAFIVLRYVSSWPNLLRVFYHECMLYFVKCMSNAFSVSIEIFIWFLSFILLMCCVKQWLICICWTILAPPGQIPVDRGISSFKTLNSVC